MGSAAIVGRDRERELITQFVTGAVPTCSSLVLTGDAGIGKTVLWESSVRSATAAGQSVLISRAGIAEARLPWVGLTDLLMNVPEAILDELPAPQRRALDVVMLQAIDENPVDERIVGTGIFSIVTTLAAQTPVLLAVDDLPYLDIASAGALRFALRRLQHTTSVRFIATVRGTQARPAPLDGVASDRIRTLEVGPLTAGALFELLSEKLGVRLARPLLLRVQETSGGNPLYALELARALDRLEIVPTPGTPLPLPLGLNALVAERIASLPPDILEITACTAASWRCTDARLDPLALDRAIRVGVVVVDSPLLAGARSRSGERVVRASHPLLGAAAYAALSPDRRHALHRRLSEAADDPVEHARHAALAVTSPGPELGPALDAGVAAALTAGTADIAADLARLALECSDNDDDRLVRLDRLAVAQSRTSDTTRALDTLARAVELTPYGPRRAFRRIRMAEGMVEVTGWESAAAELQAALIEADGDAVVISDALLTLASITDDIPLADASAARAVELLAALDDPDPTVLAGALSQAAGARFRAGRGLDHDAFRRAIDIEARYADRRLSERADASYAALLKYADELDEAEARLTALLVEARGSGDLSAIAYVLGHLPHIGLWRGRIAAVRDLPDEHVAIAEQAGLTAQMAQAINNRGIVLAHEGRLDEADRILTELASGDATGLWDRQRALGALGFVALSRGDAAGAAVHLDQWHALMTQMSFGEPGYSRSHLDYLAALVETGRLADADAFLAHLDYQVETSGRRSAAAVAITGRAMLAAARGRPADAQATIAQALEWYETSQFRFDRARVLLIAGRIHRRAKAKTAARNALVEAEREFTAFGAPAWVAQVQAELARVNLRPNAPASLTETERRVAELTAAGLTNREVAQRLFLAVKTVESNLARVYRKLGIRSRAELGARMSRASSDPTSSGRATSDPTSSDRASSDPTSSDRASSDPTSSDRASSDPASSDRVEN